MNHAAVHALRAMNELLEAMQADVGLYLVPDSGFDAKWLAGQLIARLDGPRQREVQSYARSVLDNPDAVPLLPKPDRVAGDLLPPIGARVWIRHGRDEDAHACIVTGYYAWVDLNGIIKHLSRVFVQMVYEGTTTPQARLLCDVWPTAEAALRGDYMPSTYEWHVPAAWEHPHAFAHPAPGTPEAQPITGTPEGHLLQDLHRQLSRWLESRPDSMLHAREAAAAIQSPCSAQCDEEAEHVTFKSGGATVTRGMFARDEGAAAPGAETVDQPRICLTVAQLESVAAALAMVDQQEQARTGQRRRGWDHAYVIRSVREALATLNAAGIKGL